jgi:hypothetical protein
MASNLQFYILQISWLGFASILELLAILRHPLRKFGTMTISGVCRKKKKKKN